MDSEESEERKNSKPRQRPLFLFGLLGFLVSLACLGVILFYTVSDTLASMGAPESVGNVYYSLGLAWVIGSLFGYIPLLLAIFTLPIKKMITPIAHVIIMIAGGYVALFAQRPDPVRPGIIAWLIISVVTLLLLGVLPKFRRSINLP